MAARDWPERTRMLVTVGVVVGVNLLMCVGLYLVHGEFKAQEEIHKKKVAERDSLKKEVDQEDAIAQELKTLQDEIKATKEKLPEKEDISQLITKIAAVAASVNCSMLSESRQPGGPGQATAGLSVSQEIWKTRWKADFMSFCTMVNKIEEHFGRFIAFENMMITPANSGMVATGAQEDISVDLVTYRYTGQ